MSHRPKLYVAHVSFCAPRPDGDDELGHFVCTCQADDVALAVEIVRGHVTRTQAAEAFLPAGARVYIDDVIELPADPSAPVLSGYSSASKTMPGATTERPLLGESAGAIAHALEDEEPFLYVAAEERAMQDCTDSAPAGDDVPAALDQTDSDAFDDDALWQDPLWLVRWQNLSAAIIRAPDKRHVRMIMDEVADPGGCEIVPYDGAVWFELNLSAGIRFKKTDDDEARGQPLREEDVELDKVNSLLSPGFVIAASIGGGDTGCAMHDEILETAFPAIAAVRDAHDLDARPSKKARAEIRAAVMEDLAPLFRHSWRSATQQRRAGAGDREAAIREMSIRCARTVLAA